MILFAEIVSIMNDKHIKLLIFRYFINKISN